MKYPSIGDEAQSEDYDGQPYLYHYTTRAGLQRIRVTGNLRPGSGECLGRSSDIRELLCRNPRLFFSTQPDKWSARGMPLLRTPTRGLACRYDGGEWIYDSDDEPNYVEGRLADCATTQAVPVDRLEIRTRRGWKPLTRGTK